MTVRVFWLLNLVIFFSSRGASALPDESTCSSALRESVFATRSGLDDVHGALEAARHAEELETELRALSRESDPAARDAALAEIEDPSTPRNSAFLRRVFGGPLCLKNSAKSVPSSVRLARMQMWVGWGFSGAAMTAATVNDKEHEIPFGALAHTIVMGLATAEMRCRWLSKDTRSDEVLRGWSGRIKASFRAYRNQLVLSVPSAGLFMVAIAAEDKARGREADFEYYAKLGTVSLAWDLAFSAVNITFIEPLIHKTFPTFQRMMGAFLDGRFVTGVIKRLSDSPHWFQRKIVAAHANTKKPDVYLEINEKIVLPRVLERLSQLLKIPVVTVDQLREGEAAAQK